MTSSLVTASPQKHAPSSQPSSHRDTGDAAGIVSSRCCQEHYIPIRKRDLVRLLIDENLDCDKVAFRDFANSLEQQIHSRYHKALEDLKDHYAEFDPDNQTFTAHRSTVGQRQALVPLVFSQVTELLERANYRKLTRDQFKRAIGQASHWGVRLRVNFELLDRLEVYARGNVVEQRTVRRAANLWRRRQVEVPTFQRMVVVFRLKPHDQLPADVQSEAIHVRVFKNVPHQDVDMLLPGTEARISWVDQGKILFPSIPGLTISLIRLIKGAIVFTLAAGLAGTLGLLGLISGAVGYGVRSFLGYLQFKDKHLLNLTRCLYFQCLDNNAGVLCQLADAAEAQEFRETLLAYFLLWRFAPPQGWRAGTLDKAVESFLFRSLRLHLDFEVDDAIRKLRDLGLLQMTPSRKLRVLPIKAALDRLVGNRSSGCL